MLTTLIAAAHFAAMAPVAPDALDRFIYPLSPAQPCPPITVDVSAAPDLAEWAEKAKVVAREWYPQICQLLDTRDFKSPATLKFVFRENQQAPAYCAGNEISYSVEWVRKNPHDFGMVVHELTHVVQAYPSSKYGAGWLTEGIADYIRWWRYEPESPRPRIDFAKASYKDAYRTTAYFLAWATHKYDRRLVPQLDAAMRKAEDPEPIFKSVTGKSASELWDEFKVERS